MKKGFVLVETIVVMCIICIILVMLYGAYNNLLITVQKRSLYDNTEYIYKTSVIREYLEDNLNPNEYNSSPYKVICQNKNSNNKCYSSTITGNYQNELFKFFKVEAIYITIWNVSKLSDSDIAGFEATTQHYIRSLDPTNESYFRIIVMFEQENNSTTKNIYEYASLRFGSRG